MYANHPESSRDQNRLNRVFQSLADPSRRKIIALLRETEELTVGDIAQVFSMSLNGVSKHLKALEAAGLVRRRIDGRQHWIRVDWKALQPAHTWLDFHRHFWSTRLDRLASQLEKKQKTKKKTKNERKKS
ncbi:MAG: metalloregulator ArsR/SmtB family transcription factor [Acidobacteriota bacterium]